MDFNGEELAKQLNELLDKIIGWVNQDPQHKKAWAILEHYHRYKYPHILCWDYRRDFEIKRPLRVIKVKKR